MVEGGEKVLFDRIKENNNLLPNLRALEGSPCLLSALIRMRRISDVIVLPSQYMDMKELASSLEHALVPTTSVCIVQGYETETTGWDLSLKLLQTSSVSSVIKEISIVKELKQDSADGRPGWLDGYTRRSF
ncbi:hypothetical protein OPQ81_000639 [Rhizoctonia solani]|nr:hypothetical protein OPQ81_000639 [Rhizoctonia solani]